MLYGVILTVSGIVDSEAEIDKAAGVNINLWTGLGMLALGLCFLVWVLARPLTTEEIIAAQKDEPEEEEGRRSGAGRGRRRSARRVRVRGRAGCGGSSASTAPPKPPPTMRAPAAPARLSALDGRLDLGHRRLVVVAQARVRGVEQRADLLEVAGARAPSIIASTRAFSLSTWRTRRRSGSGEPLEGLGVASRGARRRAPRRRRGTPRGARCSRRRRARARRPTRA